MSPDADEEDDLSFFDQVLVGGEAQDESGYDRDEGVDLDEQQSVEIRRIFLITLPQYLDPVQQMVQLLVSEGEGDGETLATLDAALGSIADAAERIGIDDVLFELRRMRTHLARLPGSSSETRALIQQAMVESLREIRRISGLDEIGGDRPNSDAEAAIRASQEPVASTIFGALRGVEGVDAAALAKLTAAGLVSVEQLRLARPDEVAAVTGLSDALVSAILRAVADRDPAPARGLGVSGGAEPPRPESPAPPARAQDMSDGGGDLAREVEEAIRRQVEEEAAHQQARAAAQRARARLSSLRAELPQLEQEREALRRRLQEAERRILEGLGGIANARSIAARQRLERDRLEAEADALGEALEELRALREGLRREGGITLRKVGELSERIRRALEGVHRARRGSSVAGGGR